MRTRSPARHFDSSSKDDWEIGIDGFSYGAITGLLGKQASFHWLWKRFLLSLCYYERDGLALLAFGIEGPGRALQWLHGFALTADSQILLWKARSTCADSADS